MDQEYQFKCKKKIRDAINSDYSVIVTKRKVQLWFNILNYLFFKNQLPKFTEIEISRFKTYHAMCECDEKDGSNKLFISEKFENKKRFVEVMLHEMIHLHDFVMYRKMTHGKKFFEWKKNLEKYGLDLYIKF